MATGDVDIQVVKPRTMSCNLFDGVDDYVEIAHHPDQLGANLKNGFTISAWINARSVGENKGAIFDKSSGAQGANGFLIYTESTNRIKFVMNNGTEHASGNNVVLYGIWYHILYTISSEQLCNLYINGVLTGAANQNLVQTISTITTTNAPRIGNVTGGTTKSYDGSIRSVKMWDRVLTTTEITEEYNMINHQTGLLHHYKLGGDYTDYGNTGVTATNSGSVVVDALDDNIAQVIKAQRALYGSSTKFSLVGGDNEVACIAIDEA